MKTIKADCPCGVTNVRLTYIRPKPWVGIKQGYYTGTCPYGHVVQRIAKTDTPR